MDYITLLIDGHFKQNEPIFYYDKKVQFCGHIFPNVNAPKTFFKENFHYFYVGLLLLLRWNDYIRK